MNFGFAPKSKRIIFVDTKKEVYIISKRVNSVKKNDLEYYSMSVIHENSHLELKRTSI